MQDLAAAATARGQVYGFLATVFLKPLDAETLQRIRVPTFLAALRDANMDLGRAFAEAPEARLLEQLAVDYTQLFHGPRGHIVLYESVHADPAEDGLNGAATAAVSEFLASAGVAIEPAARLLPDHLGAELDVMAVLARQEARAWDAGDRPAARDCLWRQASFSATHLASWIPGICQAVRRKAQTRFYREAASLLEDLLAQDSQELDRRLLEIDGAVLTAGEAQCARQAG